MQHEIAVIPGDGIGPEVVTAGLELLDAAAQAHGGVRFRYRSFPWGCQHYHQHGKMASDDYIQTLSGFESIFLGAVGWPGVPDHVSLWGLLIPIRRRFEQAVNHRPVRLLRGIKSPLESPGEIDIVVVRENTEGEYSNMGGRIYEDTPAETVVQNTIFTRRGVERVLRYAFDLAQKRTGRLISATKSNGINITMPFWDEVVRQIGAEYPTVAVQPYHIDALSAYFVLRPATLDVVVGSNLFGDILSDLGAAVVGGIGLAPSANLNLDGKYPSMFEPVHGSAPDIAGQSIANPVAAIWSAALMAEHLGHPEIGRRMMTAMEETLAAGIKTPDLKGTASTAEMVAAVKDRILQGQV